MAVGIASLVLGLWFASRLTTPEPDQVMGVDEQREEGSGLSLAAEGVDESSRLTRDQVVAALLSGLFFWWISLFTDTMAAKFDDFVVGPALTMGAVVMIWLLIQTRTRNLDRLLFTVTVIVLGATPKLDSSWTPGWSGALTLATWLALIVFAMPLDDLSELVRDGGTHQAMRRILVPFVIGTIGAAGVTLALAAGRLAYSDLTKTSPWLISDCLVMVGLAMSVVALVYPSYPNWRWVSRGLTIGLAGFCLVFARSEHFGLAALFAVWSGIVFATMRLHGTSGKWLLILFGLATSVAFSFFLWPQLAPRVTGYSLGIAVFALAPVRRAINPDRWLRSLDAGVDRAIEKAFARMRQGAATGTLGRRNSVTPGVDGRA